MRSPRSSSCMLVAVMIGFGCSKATATPQGDLSAPDTIVVVVMENHGYADVIGNADMPYLNDTILPSSISLTDMKAEAHPSLPNYAYLAAGTTCGATDDADWGLTCPSLFDQLLGKGIGWRTYAEGYPGDANACDLTSSTEGGGSNDYARKHVPPLLFASTSSGSACTTHLANFPGDTPVDGAPPAASFNGVDLPAVTVVIPNLCHDMHDSPDECGPAGGGVSGGDDWLRSNWNDLVSAAGQRGAVILTWDEAEGEDQQIATLIGGENLAGVGSSDGGVFDHASILRAIEDALGLPCLADACDASPIPLKVSANG